MVSVAEMCAIFDMLCNVLYSGVRQIVVYEAHYICWVICGFFLSCETDDSD